MIASGAGNGCRPSLRAPRSSNTPEDFTGSGGIGYGLLRGWNEGYEIPSLGVAVHPSMRGTGLGRLIMDFLEAMARMRGASSIRLRVRKDNAIAHGMYARRGYRLTPDVRDASLIVGIKSLRRDAG